MSLDVALGLEGCASSEYGMTNPQEPITHGEHNTHVIPQGHQGTTMHSSHTQSEYGQRQQHGYDTPREEQNQHYSFSNQGSHRTQGYHNPQDDYHAGGHRNCDEMSTGVMTG